MIESSCAYLIDLFPRQRRSYCDALAFSFQGKCVAHRDCRKERDGRWSSSTIDQIDSKTRKKTKKTIYYGGANK